MEELPATSLLDLPNDILVQILKILPLVPDLWSCILACKRLKNASNLPSIWNYVTIQTSSFKRRKRSYYDAEDENKNKHKKTTLSLNPRHLVKFILSNHAKDIVELDLTGALFETERDYNSRKKIYSRRTALNDAEEISNLLTDLLLRLPNIQRLSLRGSGWESGSKPLPTIRKLGHESSLRELNLNQSTLVNFKHKHLKRLLKVCPKLETLFVAGLSLDAPCGEVLCQFGKKLKALDLTTSAISVSYLARELPDLTLLMNMKNEWEANRASEDLSNVRKDITVVANGLCRNTIWKVGLEDIKKVAPAIKNLTYCDAFGSTIFHKFVDADSSQMTASVLEYLAKTLHFDVNVAISVVGSDQAKVKPWLPNFPYDTTHDNVYGDTNWNHVIAKTIEAGDTALHKAVKMSRLWHVKQLLSIGADVNARNKENRTPLCYANSTEEVHILIESGADAKVIDKNGWSVIMNFIANKSRLPNPGMNDEARKNVIRRLAAVGCDIEHRAESGLSALEMALLCADWPTAVSLLEAAGPSSENNVPQAALGPLHCICLAKVTTDKIQAQLETLRVLLNTKADLMRVDEQGQTAMHLACIIHRYDLADAMLLHATTEETQKIFSMQDKFGYTALHYAFLPSMSDEEAENLPHYNRSMLVNGKDAWVKKVKQIRAKLPSLDVDAENFYRLLLGVAGLNLNVTSSSGETALLLSCKSICPDKEASGLAGRLLQAGADPNIADDQGTTPLQLAAYSQKQLLAKLLLMYNADADLADRKGVNGLIAGVIGYLKVTEELTEQKKRADQYNSGAVEESANTIESRTEKAVATFQVLLDAILPVVKDINKADEVLGKTALHYLCACTSASEHIKTLVRKYGANMEIRDVAGETPIHDTLRKSNWQSLKTLIDLGCDVNSVGSRGYSPLHKALSMSEIYRLSRVEGDLFAEGYKIVGHSLVFYPSWLWVSIEDEETTVNNNNRVYRNDWEYYEQMYRLVFVLFTAADKLNFSLVNCRGELPLHLAWFFDEEERVWVESVFADFPYFPENISKQDLAWVIPLLVLQYTTKEHFAVLDFTGQSPLHTLLCTNYVRPSYYSTRSPSYRPGVAKVVKLCLEKGADTAVVTKDEERENALILACRNNVYSDILELLLDHNTSVALGSAVDSHGDTLLHKVLRSNRDMRDENEAAVLLLLERFPDLVNAYNDAGLTPLMVFIKDFDYNSYNKGTPPKSKVIEYLLKFKGLDVNARSRETGETALHYLCAWWYPFSIYGAFYNNSDLYYHIGNDSMLVHLIEAGADPSIKDNSGKTCFDILPNLRRIVDKYGQFMLSKAKVSTLPKPSQLDFEESQQTRILDILQVTFARPHNAANAQINNAQDDGDDEGLGLFD